jgi:choline dehydrogenase-like flavoprotein
MTQDLRMHTAPAGYVKAKKEVVLSAGSVGTPQILLLSGIGASDELTSSSVAPLVDLPSVGKNLSDHVLLPNVFSVQGTESLDSLLRDGNAVNAAIEEWQTNKTGPLVHGITNQLGFLRLPDSLPIFSEIPDPASGPKASHWEMIFSVRILS